MFKYVIGLSILFYFFNMIIKSICKDVDDIENKLKYIARIELAILAIVVIYAIISS